MFGQITHKGPSKKVSGRIGAGYSQNGPKRCRIFKKLCCLYFPLRIHCKLDFSQIVTLKWLKNCSNVDKTREIMFFQQRGPNFSQRQKFWTLLAGVRCASKIKWKNVNKKRMATARRLIFWSLAGVSTTIAAVAAATAFRVL
jgi:hypothetical protein